VQPRLEMRASGESEGLAQRALGYRRVVPHTKGRGGRRQNKPSGVASHRPTLGHEVAEEAQRGQVRDRRLQGGARDAGVEELEAARVADTDGAADDVARRRRRLLEDVGRERREVEVVAQRQPGLKPARDHRRLACTVAAGLSSAVCGRQRGKDGAGWQDTRPA
jgi:hypothetical protein